MEEEYSRRKQQRPPATSKKTIVIVILLLFLNTLALGLLLFLNVQASSKQEEQLYNIEKQVSQLDKAKVVDDPSTETDSTEHNVPLRESSTQVSSAVESSSSVESSTQPIQTTPSSEVTERSTEPVATPTATTYVVQSGDTLSVIAEKNKISLQDLMQKNNLTDSTVYIGQVLSLQ
ncbi:LysM peptidoglycan-binding domain-containing protein [Enterococcus caccae]|uniref:LysM domain-containing protein n=1 Tax=Enterococcus caccae ATCC BAA-1240 TaxID=1158612 RepID=R3X732_9ENTE|nr:LysM peptidoglycan-binding domain-containing protein [Enterococcus caccae]EOL49905.1 hypothetical protein UC7_00570 [Enterococcus caccae ATCC BAA-1240]EOT56245.1 hypothetical protein I580_03045 [Enterococcus caccae ATCC BAA-1240]OJG26576.1 hypothetical protein RU98_GL000632 [Enterococcus caccae]